MSKHTPGPWRVVAGDNYRIESDAIPDKYPHAFPGDDLGAVVAYVGNRQADFGEADARLMAAAPKMASAIRAILFQVCQGKVLERDACITQAREALASAGVLE